MVSVGHGSSPLQVLPQHVSLNEVTLLGMDGASGFWRLLNMPSELVLEANLYLTLDIKSDSLFYKNAYLFISMVLCFSILLGLQWSRDITGEVLDFKTSLGNDTRSQKQNQCLKWTCHDLSRLTGHFGHSNCVQPYRRCPNNWLCSLLNNFHMAIGIP